MKLNPCRKNKRQTSFAIALFVFVALTLHCTSAMADTVVIANERSGDLVFMDEAGKTKHIVELCGRPRGMVHRTSARTLYVACSDDGQVVELDIDTRKIINVFSDLSGAMSLALHEASNRLIVSNEGFAKATVIDINTGKVLANLPTGLEPDGVLITDDGQKIFVASENAGLVHVFDGNTYAPINSLVTNLRPRRMALRHQELWVSSEMGSRVEIFNIDNSEKIDEIIFAPRGFRSEQLTPVDILFDDARSTGFVALGSANHVAFINAEKREIDKYILVGHRPWGLGLTPDGSKLFVLNGLSDDVTIIDVARKRPVRTSRTGLVPHAVEIVR